MQTLGSFETTLHTGGRVGQIVHWLRTFDRHGPMCVWHTTISDGQGTDGQGV